MDTLNRLYGVHSKIKQIFLALGGAGVFCMMLYITVDVIVRNVANKALVGTFEVVSYYLMPLTILPSFCLALSAGVMPRIVAVVNKLPKKAAHIISIIVLLIEIAAYVIMMVFSMKYAIQATQDKLTFIAGTTSLPVWFMYYLPPFSFLMMTIESLFVLVKNILDKNATTILFADKVDPDEENASI